MARAGMAIDPASVAAAEGRVDQHQRRLPLADQQIMDMFAIMAGDDLAETLGQEVGTGRIMFVEKQMRARPQAMDRQHAGAGRGFEQHIVRSAARRHGHEPGQGDRRAELLEIDLLFRTVGLGRQAALELPQAFENVGRRAAGRFCGSARSRTPAVSNAS
jgi:hypothetical protein